MQRHCWKNGSRAPPPKLHESHSAPRPQARSQTYKCQVQGRHSTAYIVRNDKFEDEPEDFVSSSSIGDIPMEAEARKYERYRSDLKFMLVCSGLWPDYERHPKIIRILLSCCSAFLCAFVTFGIVRFCIKFATNINLLTRGLGLAISFGSAFLKICTLWLHQEDLRKLNGGVSASFARDLKVPEYRVHLLAHFRTFSKFFYTFGYSVAINVVLSAVVPLTFIKRGKYIRMHPQILPFTYAPGGTIHWIIYGFEFIAGFFLWSVTSGVDSFFGFYTFHVVGELRLLSYQFQQLQSNDNYAKNLKECVCRHVQLLRAKRILERVFGFLAIWLAVTCAICLCTLIFQATEVCHVLRSAKHLSIVKVCYLICYTTLKLIQAYSYAWFGAIISIESKKCLEAMYNAQWPGSGDTNFMKDVLIVLSQKPMAFIAKGVMLLELDMFMKIVNTTVSYFFLLQTLDENLE